MQPQITETQSKGMTDEKVLRQEQLLGCSRDQSKSSVAEANERIERSGRRVGGVAPSGQCRGWPLTGFWWMISELRKFSLAAMWQTDCSGARVDREQPLGVCCN